MADTQSDVAAVTGANSGIGRAVRSTSPPRACRCTAPSAASNGRKLQGLAAEAGVEVDLVELDVADSASVEAGLARVLDEAGRVDVRVKTWASAATASSRR